MSLRMPRPWPHPRTGVYYLRQRRPAEFKDVIFDQKVAITVGDQTRHVAVGDLVKVSLGTKDREEAKARHREADAALQHFWQRHREGPQPLVQKQIQALAGLLYTELVAMMDSEPGEVGIWEEVLKLNRRVADNGGLEQWFGPSVDQLFATQGIRTDALSRTRVVHATFTAIQQAAEVNLLKAQGDYSPDEGAKRYPRWEPSSEATAPQDLGDAGKFDLFSLLDHKFTTGQGREATRKDYHNKLRHFVAMIGHSDARKVTNDSVREWRDKLIQDGLGPKTINDKYKAALSSVLAHAVNEFGLAENVAKGFRDKRKGLGPKEPPGYDEDQAKTILAATFKGTSKALSPPHQRALFWVPWICAFQGLRVTEVTQLRGIDVRREDHVPLLLIRPDAGSTKSDREWATAIHPSLLEMGLLDMFTEVGDGPAFYTPYPPEDYVAGKPPKGRANEAGNRVTDWIKNDLGISAPLGHPNHAWRHRFTTLSRLYDLGEQARDYMMGSGPKNQREKYGGWPALALRREIEKLPRLSVETESYRPSNEAAAPQPMRAVSAKQSAPTRQLRATIRKARS